VDGRAVKGDCLGLANLHLVVDTLLAVEGSRVGIYLARVVGTSQRRAGELLVRAKRGEGYRALHRDMAVRNSSKSHQGCCYGLCSCMHDDGFCD